MDVVVVGIGHFELRHDDEPSAKIGKFAERILLPSASVIIYIYHEP